MSFSFYLSLAIRSCDLLFEIVVETMNWPHK